jgi:molybdopterin-guanine dinucleotide biosynthesis protein A
VYYRRVDDVTGFVLAGGKSTRMGQDKAFLEWRGQTLLCRALEIVGGVTEELRIVGDIEKFSKLGRVVEDLYRERGPLGGIQAALSSSGTEWNLMLAVDLPFVETDFLRWLVGQARKGEALVTVPRVGGRLQPLCGVYRRGFGEVAQGALEAGKNKIDPLFTEVNTQLIAEKDILERGYSPDMFQNLNTLDEYRIASSQQKH